MKQVFEPRELCHVWAHQMQDSGRTAKPGNIFFDGRVIYSYGHHFPMAAIAGEDIVFITSRRYSITTTKHQEYVSAAVSHLTRVYCYDPEDAVNGFHARNVADFASRIEIEADKLPRSRKPEKYFGEIENIKAAAVSYLGVVGKQWSDFPLVYARIAFAFETDFLGSVDKARAKVIERADKQRAAMIEAARDAGPVYDRFNEAWHNYEDVIPTVTEAAALRAFKAANDVPTLLRTDGVNVETSKGMSMGVDIAKRFYLHYLRTVEAGGCAGNCSGEMLGYQITRISSEWLVVGCHDIPASEIHAIAKRLNW